MKNSMIIGIALIAIGVAILGYRQLKYKTRETVLELGPIKATAEKTETIPLPPILGWALIGGGAAVLIFKRRQT